MKLRNGIIAVLAMTLGLGSVGCATNTGNGALLGGAGGALAGAAIGSRSHSRAGAGALLGGAIGAIGGGIIGNEMDRQDRSPRYAYDRGGYSRGYSRDRYYDDDYYDRGAYRTRYYRYDDCPPPRYEYRTIHTYGGRGRYYESTYYEYD